MCGCEICEIVFASRSKRWRSSGEEERCCGRTLIATVRSRRVSRARYTSPIPPAPRGERTSYGPSRLPAAIPISGGLSLQGGRPVLDEGDRRRSLFRQGRDDEKTLSVRGDVVVAVGIVLHMSVEEGGGSPR